MKHRLVLFIFAMIAFAAIGFWNPAPVQAYSPGTSIQIPAINVQSPIRTAYIRQFANGSITWDMAPFRWSVAHLEGTAWFGQRGNVVLGGHSEIAPGKEDIFYYLNHVKVGDEIVIQAEDAEIRYVIQEVKTVHYTDLSVLSAKFGEQLTLITCNRGSYDKASGQYTERVIVIAQRVA